MEGSTELLSEEKKVSMEQNKKRMIKTPAQVLALEKFYNDHKYPSEEMKLELANELALTGRQVSGWFCHRRLKDKKLLKNEVCANGRQDRSSGVFQDHGSGLGQDSCGSTKHGDNRFLDPKEVESHGLYNHEFSLADMTYGRRNQYIENDSEVDNTSSESSSSLQDRLFPQGQDPYDMEPSRYLSPNADLPPQNLKGAINMGYKPSGYLKVKGEIEHAAITAVKKQLGRHYQEDGPLLSVEFDTIPPGAFECQTADPVHEELYYVANPALPKSSEISAVKRQSSHSTRYDSYFTKCSSQDTLMERGDFGFLHDSDFQVKKDKKARQHIKRRPTFHSYTNPFPGRNSSLDLYEDSTWEASAYNSTKNHRMGTMHGVEGMRSDSSSNHCDHYEENVQRSEHEEKFNGDIKPKKQYHDSDGVRMLSNEMMVAKQENVYLPQQYGLKQAPVAELEPRRNQRSAAEVPSSFTEDETAETSSSLDC